VYIQIPNKSTFAEAILIKKNPTNSQSLFLQSESWIIAGSIRVLSPKQVNWTTTLFMTVHRLPLLLHRPGTAAAIIRRAEHLILCVPGDTEPLAAPVQCIIEADAASARCTASQGAALNAKGAESWSR
jgi:hypothetical protein